MQTWVYLLQISHLMKLIPIKLVKRKRRVSFFFVVWVIQFKWIYKFGRLVNFKAYCVFLEIINLILECLLRVIFTIDNGFNWILCYNFLYLRATQLLRKLALEENTFFVQLNLGLVNYGGFWFVKNGYVYRKGAKWIAFMNTTNHLLNCQIVYTTTN